MQDFTSSTATDMSYIERDCLRNVAMLIAWDDPKYFRSVHEFMMGLCGRVIYSGFDYRNSIVWC